MEFDSWPDLGRERDFGHLCVERASASSNSRYASIFCVEKHKNSQNASKFDEFSTIVGFLDTKRYFSSQFSTLWTRSTRKNSEIVLRREFRVHVRVGRASRQTAS